MILIERLGLVYLFTIIFALISCVILNEPFKDYIAYNINMYHPNNNNSSLYTLILITIMFYLFISMYDKITRK